MPLLATTSISPGGNLNVHFFEDRQHLFQSRKQDLRGMCHSVKHIANCRLFKPQSCFRGHTSSRTERRPVVVDQLRYGTHTTRRTKHDHNHDHRETTGSLVSRSNVYGPKAKGRTAHTSISTLMLHEPSVLA